MIADLVRLLGEALWAPLLVFSMWLLLAGTWRRWRRRRKRAWPARIPLNERASRYVSPALREAIYRRDRFRCRICRRRGSTVKLEVDHIIPIARGGLTVIDNLQSVCSRCNRLKADRPAR